MLFTWSTKDLCIVFRSWRVDGVLSLILSLAAIVALGAGYEAVRELSRRYDASVAASRIDTSPSKSSPTSLILYWRAFRGSSAAPRGNDAAARWRFLGGMGLSPCVAWVMYLISESQPRRTGASLWTSRAHCWP
jgi:hypothetical protein